MNFCSLLALLSCPVTGAAYPAGVSAPPPLRVGIPVNTPPLAFLNDQGTAPRGMAVDLATMLAARIKREVRFIQDSPSNLRHRLETGSIDFIAGIPQPREATPGADILVTPFDVNRRILVAAPEAHVTCEQDYAGRRILVLADDPYLETIEKERGTPLRADTYQEAISRLARGEADAFVAQSGEVATYVAQRMGLTSVRFMGLSLERTPIVMEVGGLTPDLSARLSAAMASMATGRNIDLLRDKWLGRSLETQSFWEVYKRRILSLLGGGTLIALLVMAWIILLRRQVRLTTQNLQSSERRYRELIEASPDMTLLLGEDGSIRLANRIARETLGLGPEDEPGSMALWEALCEQGRGCMQMLLKNAAAEQRVREEIILHPDEERMRLMEFIAFPTDAGVRGNSLVCCIGRDMTERRRLEMELIEVERLAVIGQTAAGLAHEINNPLGIIMAHTDVALTELDTRTDDGLKHHLNAISRNVERAATTTRRLLNLAVPQSINIAPQNISDILLESLAFLRPRMKEVDVDNSGLPFDLQLPGDRIMLEQLFVNLLLNAVESMEGKGRLSIRGGKTHREDGQIVRVEIEDSGPGILPENLEKIFDPFFTTRGSKGFGLGLYISRRITEAHKGTLHAVSPPPGGGAILTLEFRAA